MGVLTRFDIILMSCILKKNVLNSVFNTFFSFDDKTKDNPQSCQDTINFYNRPQLAKDSNGKYPNAIYTIYKEARAILFSLMKGLKFLDGYVSNLDKCRDKNAKRICGM